MIPAPNDMLKTYLILLSFLMLFFTLPAQELARVDSVIDGDTFRLENREKVRLIGIDAPETNHPGKPVEYFGKEASEFTERMLEDKKVRLEMDVQERDKYGRLLAYVYLEDSTFVNAELLKQGYAQVATYPPNVKYVELFVKLQKEARENKRGLWKEKAEAVNSITE
jgi:micrococcal nuclease